MMSLAQRVRDFRYSKGWGPDELASRADISRTALYQIESGKTELPRAATLRRIALALDVSLDTLLGHADGDAAAQNGVPKILIPHKPRASAAEREARAAQRWQSHSAHGGSTIEDPDGLMFASDSKDCCVVDEPVSWRERELMSKLHALLNSPLGESVARIVEESYRLLPRMMG